MALTDSDVQKQVNSFFYLRSKNDLNANGLIDQANDGLYRTRSQRESGRNRR